MLQLILQFEMGAKLLNFFAPGFHFSCALLFFVLMIVMSSHDGVHGYFSMSAITCLNKSYLWNCLMDSRIGSWWTMGGWCFDDRLPKVFSMFFSPSMNGQFTLQLKQTNCQFFDFCNTWAMTTSVVKNHSTATSYVQAFFAGVHTLRRSNVTFAGQKIQPTCVDALVFARPLGKRMFLQSCFCQRVSCRQPGLKELNPNGVYHLRLCQAGQLGLLRTFRT